MNATTGKPRALIVDDDPTLRRMAQVILERGGFDVSIASEGSEGVRHAMVNPPQVIILDIMMAGLHGFEVCKMLRANASLKNTAIIFTSGKSYKPDIDKAMEIGADAYIIKPFAPKELLDIAIQHMNKRMSLI
jgi:DNA-binding response OmpR family regulator